MSQQSSFYLARAAEDVNARLVHYSTDFVFDGSATTPYTEDVRPSPRGIYAASKLLGEWFALEAPHAYVLRVESLFGSPAHWTGRRGTLDGIVSNLEQGREVRAFTDRTVSPGYVVDIADGPVGLRWGGSPMTRRQPGAECEAEKEQPPGELEAIPAIAQ